MAGLEIAFVVLAIVMGGTFAVTLLPGPHEKY